MRLRTYSADGSMTAISAQSLIWTSTIQPPFSPRDTAISLSTARPDSSKT
jgi:hypothetical protein